MNGQTTIEFLFIVIIAMVYVSSVVVPELDVSKTAADDTIQLAQTKIAAEKLANAIDSVAAATGEAKQTITLFVPARGTIECVNCTDISNPAGCESTGSFNAIKLTFFLVRENFNLLLEHPSCSSIQELGEEDWYTCLKAFPTISTFGCNDTAGNPLETIGYPDQNVSTTKEVSIKKSDSGLIVIIPN